MRPPIRASWSVGLPATYAFLIRELRLESSRGIPWMTATRRYTIADLIREPMIKRLRTIPIVVVLLAGPIAVGMLAGLPRPALAQAADPADAFFNDNVLHEIRLSVNTKDWQVLTENWLDDTKYPADFRWNGQVVRNVAIHSQIGRAHV